MSAKLDYDAFLGLVARDGTIVQLGLAPEPITTRQSHSISQANQTFTLSA